MGTTDDFLFRTVQLVKSEQTPVAWILGSGVSIGSVPSTEEMCRTFIEILQQPTPSSSEDWGALYRDAWTKICDRFGKPRRQAIIKDLLARALSGTPDGDLPDYRNESWRLTPQLEAISKIISKLPPQQRGPIFTTNFDTLVETALYRLGVPVESVSLAGTTPLPIGIPSDKVSVVHLHGVWTDGPMLHTDIELAATRDSVSGQLAATLADRILIAAGYGGWDDVFSRTLRDIARSHRLATSNAEVLWLHHGQPVSNDVLDDLRSLAPHSLAEYDNFNFKTLRDTIDDAVFGHSKPSIPAATGVNLLWPQLEVRPVREEILKFVDGASPSTSVTADAPRMALALRALTTLRESVGTESRVAVLAPTGEGKTTALFQAVRDFSLSQDSNHPQAPVVHIERGARIPDETYFRQLRSMHAASIVVVDEADLVLGRLVESLARSHQTGIGTITLFVAMHKRYEYLLKARAGEEASWSTVEPPSMGHDDARLLAEAWQRWEVLPESWTSRGIEAVADAITSSAVGATTNSLFGAMLHLWESEELDSRLQDLLIRLERQPIGTDGMTFRFLLEAIAVVHRAHEDDQGQFALGISQVALGRLVGFDAPGVLRFLVKPLGEEAAIATIGTSVFVRHSAIADRIVDLMDDDRLHEIVRKLGGLSGSMRIDRGIYRDNLVALTSLHRQLEPSLSLTCTEAALRAGHLVATRVDYLWALRKSKQLEDAIRHAKAVTVHLADFPDANANWRGVYVEWSASARALGLPHEAIGPALVSLSDAHPGPLWRTQAEYGVVNALSAALGLAPSPERDELIDLLRSLLESVAQSSYAEHMKQYGRVLDIGPVRLVARLATITRKYVSQPGRVAFSRLLYSIGRWEA